MEVTMPVILQSFNEVFQVSIKRWNAKKDNAEELIANCALALKMANENYYKPANIPLPFDPNILLEVINQDKGFSRTLEVKKNLRITGIMMEFLILFGCTRNQANLAMAEWKEASESTVKTAHLAAMETEKDKDAIGFLFRNLAVAQFFIRETGKRAFPIGSYPKAQSAFERLRLVCEDAKIDQAYRLFISQSKLNYSEIYALLISLYPDISKHGNFAISAN